MPKFRCVYFVVHLRGNGNSPWRSFLAALSQGRAKRTERQNASQSPGARPRTQGSASSELGGSHRDHFLHTCVYIYTFICVYVYSETLFTSTRRTRETRPTHSAFVLRQIHPSPATLLGRRCSHEPLRWAVFSLAAYSTAHASPSAKTNRFLLLGVSARPCPLRA